MSDPFDHTYNRRVKAKRTYNRIKPLYWLLISLMLAVQSLAHAHEVTHIGEPDGGLCAVCSVSGNLAAALPAPEQSLVVAPGGPVLLPLTPAFASGPEPHTRQARAPPVTL